MITPQDCENMQEIRDSIDAIDRNIIEQLGLRAQYVSAAAKFKTTASGVKAPDRVKAAIAMRREWAQDNKLSPDVIEKMYQLLIDYFISNEMKEWQAK